MELKTVILECPDPAALCRFYQKLLQWPLVFQESGFLRLQSPYTGMGIGFQQNEAYIPPIWPEEPGRQQMMAHLDFGVASREEMQDAVEKALRLWAEYAKAQYGGQDWTTMLDPAGHPFCFVLWEEA